MVVCRFYCRVPFYIEWNRGYDVDGAAWPVQRPVNLTSLYSRLYLSFFAVVHVLSPLARGIIRVAFSDLLGLEQPMTLYNGSWPQLQVLNAWSGIRHPVGSIQFSPVPSSTFFLPQSEMVLRENSRSSTPSKSAPITLFSQKVNHHQLLSLLIHSPS